jgi:hypothetical protein
MELDDAATVRALWHRQRALEVVLEDDRESETVKAEALRELEEVRNAACYPSNRFCGPIQGEMKIKVRRPEARVQAPKSKLQSPMFGNEHPVNNWLRRPLIWVHRRP